jgi:uncharacterized protein
MTLKIPFSEISEHGVQFEISDSSWFPEHLRDRVGPVAARVLLVKRSENKIELRGSVKAALRLECDRCLEQYQYAFDSGLLLIVELADRSRHWRLQDMEIGKGELETIQTDEPVVDLEEILRQQILLGMPTKQLCSANCLGLCKYCGTNLNERRCGCEEKTAGSPFSALASLAGKHKD